MAEVVDGVPVVDRERAAELVKVLDEHQYRYYVLDAPTVATASTTPCWPSWRRSRRRHPALRDTGLADPAGRGASCATMFTPVEHLERMIESRQRVLAPRSWPRGPTGWTGTPVWSPSRGCAS